MLRPPQPAVYIFLLDVSRQAVETGYIKSVCDVLLEELDKLPGDKRAQVTIASAHHNIGTNTVKTGSILYILKTIPLFLGQFHNF